MTSYILDHIIVLRALAGAYAGQGVDDTVEGEVMRRMAIAHRAAADALEEASRKQMTDAFPFPPQPS